MAEVDVLQNLSLIQKVCEELENHLGEPDKDLAEFLIHLARSSANVVVFNKKLQEAEAEYAQSFVSSLYDIVQKNDPCF
jgi:hypothetical protein